MNQSKIACRQAQLACTINVHAPKPDSQAKQCIVLGDPQASLACLFAHLEVQQALTIDGWLKPELRLICVGDYFDFAAKDSVDAGYQGMQFLAWLAAHDPLQTTLLMGNHDAERVMSLAGCSGEQHYESQLACREMLQFSTPEQRRVFRNKWVNEHPNHPSIVAAHDYRNFVPEQGDLIRRLLMQGRLQLATTAVNEFRQQLLITHAGVTQRELTLVGASANAQDCVRHLNRFLADAVERVRPAWAANQTQPLDLAPLYYGWEQHRPNGGLLVHRPDGRFGALTHEQKLGLDHPLAPRSVSPNEFLIPNLHQVVGHTVAAQRLTRWLEPAVSADAQSAPMGRVLSLIPSGAQYLLVLPEERRNASSSVTFADVGLALCEVGKVEFIPLKSDN